MSGPEFLRAYAGCHPPLHVAALAGVIAAEGAVWGALAAALAGSGTAAVLLDAAGAAAWTGIVLLAAGSRRLQDWVRDGRW